MGVNLYSSEVSDSGLSGGAVAAIVIIVLLIVTVAVVVGAVIFIFLYYKGKINLKGESYGMCVREISSSLPHTYWKDTEGRACIYRFLMTFDLFY